MSLRRSSLALALAAVLLVCAASAAQDQITLTLALREDIPTVEVYREILDDFEAAYPNIKVEIYNTSSTVFAEQILVQQAAGIPPDVLYIHYTFFPELMRQNLLLDLRPFIEQDGYEFDDFFPPTIEQFTWKGEFGYAIPRETSSAAIFYNIDMFDRAGVEYPFHGWTYDDLVAMGRKLARDLDGDGNNDEFAIYGITTWFHRPNIYWSFGAEILNEDGTKFRLHEPEGVQAVQWIADLINVERIATTNWADRFATGRSAMEIVNYWQILGNLQNDFEWDAFELPAGPAGKWIRTATGAHGIMAGSRNPEAAWELLKWLSSTESQARLAKLGAIIPARRTAATSPEMMEGLPPNRRAFIDTIAFGRADNIPQEVNDAMNEYLAPVWTGAKPAAVALQEVQPIIDAILADLNQ
ncbi:MAG: extracellular solute-binding protein [Firmicutes bacterium]|nr:extracellular solute-binding protein [Bacillota bacterium]